MPDVPVVLFHSGTSKMQNLTADKKSLMKKLKHEQVDLQSGFRTGMKSILKSLNWRNFPWYLTVLCKFHNVTVVRHI